MSAKCLFCGGREATPLTNEHVNPQWLLEHLGLPSDDKMLQGVVSTETGMLVGRPRVHSSHSFVQGRVCAGCNGGWMSRLENAVRPLLVSLIDRTKPIESLSVPEAALVSKWVGKTAYMHSWAGPLKDPVQVSHLEALCGDTGELVPGVGVCGMQAEYVQPSAYIQTGHWPQLCANERPDGVATPVEAYKIGLQYRNLHLLVAFWPNQTSMLTRVTGMHVRLFPHDARDLEYAFPSPSGNGPKHVLKVFTEWLGVRHTD